MEYYVNAIKHHYADFSGRARRTEFWHFVLFNFIASVIAGVLDRALFLHGPHSVGILRTLYTLAVLVPGLAVGARRLHDTGRSAWWLLLALVPFVGWIVLLVFYVENSTPGANQYGPNPKGDMPPAPAASSEPPAPTPPPAAPTQ